MIKALKARGFQRPTSARQRAGVKVHAGLITCEPAAQAHSLKYTRAHQALNGQSGVQLGGLGR